MLGEADEPVIAEIAANLPRSPATVTALLRRWGLRLIPVLLLIAAAGVLWREFHKLSLEEVVGAIAAWGPNPILGALGLSALSFLLMGVVEWLGLRWARARMPWAPVLSGCFLANAIAHTLGANLLVSGAVRARLYDRYGVSLTQVAATTLFGGMSFAVGIAALGGGGMLFASHEALAATAAPVTVARGVGAALMIGPAAYVLLCAVRRGPVRAFGRSLELPSVWDALAQLVIGIIDNGVAAAIIWILLPPDTVTYATFVGAYAIAAVVGLVSTVPGGAGVFEGSILALLPNAHAASLAAAFLGYRLVYYLLPLLLASAALAADTVRHSRRS
jgi:uncharacterized membrane protein YbhN (UPF0104 family)